MRPFTDILRDIRRGRVVDALTQNLAEVLAAVEETNKAGSVTLKLTIKPSKTGGWEKSLVPSISVSTPKADLPEGIFFSTPDGDLVRDDPDQRPLFEDTEASGRAQPRAVGD